MPEHELKNAYIGIPSPTSIVLNKNSITLTTIGQTEQLTATIEPTISDHSVTWSSDDTTVATVVNGLVTCVTPGTCTITATTVNGLTASCGVADQQGWQPGVNTMLYLPLNSTNTVNDLSGNGYNMTNNGSVSFGTYGGVDCAYFGTTAPYGLKNTSANIISGDYTFLVWINGDASNSGTGNPRIFGGNNDWWLLWERSKDTFHPAFQGTNYGVPYTLGWHLIAFVGNISNKSFTPYKDGVQLTGGTGNSGTSYRGILIGANEGNNSSTTDRYCGYMSAVIFENRKRTAQEVLDYYDQTKANYGL